MYKYLFILCIFLTACNNTPSPKKSNNTSYPAPIPSLQENVWRWPDSLSLRFELATAFDSLDFPLQAAAQLDSILIDPTQQNNYDLHLQQAQLLEKGGDTLNAIKAYNRAIRIYPTPDALLYLANLLAEKKDSNALRVCKDIYTGGADKRQISFAVFIEGVYYARLKNNSMALQKFDQSIQQNFQLTEAYLEKAFILYEEKKYAEAVSILEKANAVRSTVADIWYWLGKCYEALQQKEKAIDSYNKALVLDEKLTEAATAIKRLK